MSGSATWCDDELQIKKIAADAMGFVTGIDEHHILFEFCLDRALWTRWLDFGKPEHRPNYVRWKF